MPSKQRSWRPGWLTGMLPVACLIAMIVALVVLQLRWSARVSEAERARLQQNLQRSTASFQSAFARDLLGICQTLQASEPRDPPTAMGHLFDRFMVWRRISRHAALIDGLYVWPQGDGKADTLLQFNPQTHQLEPTEWPAQLRSFADQSHAGARALPRRPRTWVWNEQVPVLVHPIYAQTENGNSKRPRLFGYLLVVFNSRDFERAYLPDLGRRYFPPSNGFVFQLIERDLGRAPRAIFQSENANPTGVFLHSDAVFPLLASSGPYRAPARTLVSGAPDGPASAPVYLSVSDAARWQIAVRHRSGSVDAAVNSLRRRDLAVSIVVLLVLLVSVVTILAATRRARRLARLQMEFASGVSHELRTPLAVISSAAENLADGVVTEGDRIRDYGVLIHRESQRLSGMVDHILDFTQLQSSPHSYALEPVELEDLVQTAVANERSRIQDAHVSIEAKIPANLPLLLTNGPALQQCLQNLLSNALKYGGGKILIAISSARENGEDRVLLQVRDFGMGIPPEDLPHIYEPFYRAINARDSQIPGTGLGLSLTRKMIEGMGGRITVESSPGRGTAFTLHIPAAAAEKANGTAREASRSA